jgi:predicted hydrocarbon binding protein
MVAFPADEKYLPARLIGYFRQALQESIGLTAVGRIWRNVGLADALPTAAGEDLAKSVGFAGFSGLCGSVEHIYGRDGARSILYRCGRSAFHRLLRSTSAIVGGDRPQRSSPSPSEHTVQGLGDAMRLLGLISDMDCRAETDSNRIRFHTSACPECVGRQHDGGICHGVAGMFRGALDWVGIDPEFPVVETECGADRCLFTVSTAG